MDRRHIENLKEKQNALVQACQASVRVRLKVEDNQQQKRTYRDYNITESKLDAFLGHQPKPEVLTHSHSFFCHKSELTYDVTLNELFGLETVRTGAKVRESNQNQLEASLRECASNRMELEEKRLTEEEHTHMKGLSKKVRNTLKKSVIFMCVSYFTRAENGVMVSNWTDMSVESLCSTTGFFYATEYLQHCLTCLATDELICSPHEMDGRKEMNDKSEAKRFAELTRCKNWFLYDGSTQKCHKTTRVARKLLLIALAECYQEVVLKRAVLNTIRFHYLSENKELAGELARSAMIGNGLASGKRGWVRTELCRGRAKDVVAANYDCVTCPWKRSLLSGAKLTYGTLGVIYEDPNGPKRGILPETGCSHVVTTCLVSTSASKTLKLVESPKIYPLMEDLNAALNRISVLKIVAGSERADTVCSAEKACVMGTGVLAWLKEIEPDDATADLDVLAEVCCVAHVTCDPNVGLSALCRAARDHHVRTTNLPISLSSDSSSEEEEASDNWDDSISEFEESSLVKKENDDDYDPAVGLVSDDGREIEFDRISDETFESSVDDSYDDDVVDDWETISPESHHRDRTRAHVEAISEKNPEDVRPTDASKKRPRERETSDPSLRKKPRSNSVFY